jgi:hypothetical protein
MELHWRTCEHTDADSDHGHDRKESSNAAATALLVFTGRICNMQRVACLSTHSSLGVHHTHLVHITHTWCTSHTLGVHQARRAFTRSLACRVWCAGEGRRGYKVQFQEGKGGSPMLEMMIKVRCSATADCAWPIPNSATPLHYLVAAVSGWYFSKCGHLRTTMALHATSELGHSALHVCTWGTP